MKTTHIYELVDPTTNEVRYVGKSVSPGQRFRSHISDAKIGKTKSHTNSWIQSLSSVDHKPVMRVIDDDSDGSSWIQLEQDWITFYRALGFRLTNLTDGGEGMCGYEFSDEHKTRISIAHKGKKVSDETRARMSVAQKGRKVSEETKARISVAKKGTKFSDEHRAKLSAALIGRRHTDEAKAKIGAAHKGKDVSKETKAKMSVAQKGKKHSVEARTNMSNAQQARRKREKR